MKAIATTTLPLCRALEILSEATAEEIAQGQRARQPLDEESITSYHLMRLAASVPSIVLEKHTRRREYRSGADWEIWVGRPGAFLGLRVQAKILTADEHSARYKSLFSAKKSAVVQLDKLIASAQAAIPPLYPVLAFYNPVSELTDFSAVDCPRVRPNPLLCGWTMASAERIRHILLGDPSNRLEHLASSMKPITCFFCCPDDCPAQVGTTGTLAQAVAARLERDRSDTGASPESLVTERGPVYVERLFKGESIDTGWTDLPSVIRRFFARSRQLPSGVSRVLIVRDQTELISFDIRARDSPV